MRTAVLLFLLAACTTTPDPSPVDLVDDTLRLDPDGSTDSDSDSDTDTDGCDPIDTGLDWRQDAQAFQASFETLWCQRWTDCGHDGDCVDLQPNLTHYENNDGTMDLDCQPVGCSTEWDLCLSTVEAATCSDVAAAAQVDETNGPLLEICIVWSCV